MIRLMKCNKPEGADKATYIGGRAKINDHIFQGMWVRDSYYEHDETDDQWYRLVAQSALDLEVEQRR